jgi:hypothetical protein
MSNKLWFVLLLALLPMFSIGQDESIFKKDRKKFSLPKVTVSQSGPYIGWQKGKYNALEFGFEGQYKRVKLLKSVLHAGHMGFNYNFFQNVLGYDLGYWYKQGRLNLTYGLNFCYRTNFTHNRVGLAPVLGFKFWQFHFQTGVHLLTPAPEFTETNLFFVSLRFVFIKNKKVDIDRN